MLVDLFDNFHFADTAILLNNELHNDAALNTLFKGFLWIFHAFLQVFHQCFHTARELWHLFYHVEGLLRFVIVNGTDGDIALCSGFFERLWLLGFHDNDNRFVVVRLFYVRLCYDENDAVRSIGIVMLGVCF